MSVSRVNLCGSAFTTLLTQFHWMFHAAKLIGNMLQGTNRMSKGHPGASKPHDGSDLLPLGFLVAMNRALGAGRLVLTIGALFQPFF